MDKLNVSNFGPIKEANVAFGDLTFIVGPQATGKSLFLELFKLIVDQKNIVSTLKKNNLVIKDRNDLIDCYFGKGLSSLFNSNTKAIFNKKDFDIDSLIDLNRSAEEKIFYIPAQRIMSFDDGSPKGFINFNLSTPYILRSFSENLRLFIQDMPFDIFFSIDRYKNFGGKNNVLHSIFNEADIELHLNNFKRELKLKVGDMSIPFMAWSAGQKEFMPLFLAFYSLIAPTNLIKRPDYKWVIVEEPEMGLHPKAIESVLLEIIDLMNRGYKIVVSTHSSTFLDFAWTVNCIKKNDDDTFRKAMCELFGYEPDSAIDLFDNIKKKSIKTYFSAKSNADGVVFTDISSLDACDDNIDISEWGGLSSFAGKASEVVSKYIID